MSSTLIVWLFNLMAHLPLKVLHRIGVLLGWVSYLLSGKYAARLRENLENYNADCNPSDLQKILHTSVGEAGKGIAELPWVWRRPLPEVLSKIRHCYGREYFDDARHGDKGLILLTPHLGCFEIMGLYIAAQMPITCMYSAPKRAWLDVIIRNGRQRAQMKLARADIGGVRILLKALKRGETIGLLPDQVPLHGDGEWADFFGRPAYTMSLASRLLEASGARILLCFAERRPLGEGYDIHFVPFKFDTSISITKQINSALETIICSCPAQYLWSYNRYKAPPGSMPVDHDKEKQ